MSPLTKLFVVLNVVLSLLLAAGTVTFVSSIQNHKKTAEVAMDELRAKTAEAEANANTAQQEKAAAMDAQKLMMSQIDEGKRQSNQQQQFISERDIRIAKLESEGAIHGAERTQYMEALKASEDAKSKMQETLNTLRQANDQYIVRAAQDSQTISDVTNKWEVAERERRFAAEQLEEERSKTTKLGSALQGAGINVNAVLASAGGKYGAPRINGVVRDVRTIAGLPYATISVGSSDSVAKGMEFSIVDRNTGNFLGKITIDTVEPTESTGRITGPKDKMALIKPGVEVKTQL